MEDNDLILSKEVEIYNPVNTAEIFEIEELEEMSLTQYQKAKNILTEKRKQLMLQLDSKKLQQASKIIDAMDMTLDRYFSGYDKEEVSAADLKFLSEAYRNMLQSLNTISRLDSVDSSGKSARLSLEIQFE